MSKIALSNRNNWQTEGGAKGKKAEKSFFVVFRDEFIDSEFEIIDHPTDFKNIYENIELTDEVRARIYNPNKKYKHGISPDYAIHNIKTGKKIYIEVKRQDGWVEGKPPKAGRGNVHERSCKYFTPGLKKIMKEKGRLGDNILPFWVVFIGDITRDPKRVREIHCWYNGCLESFFLWDDEPNPKRLVSHFNKKIKSFLT